MTKEEKFEIEDIKDPKEDLDLEEAVEEEKHEEENPSIDDVDEATDKKEESIKKDEKEEPKEQILEETKEDVLEKAVAETKDEEVFEEVKGKPKKTKKKINWKMLMIIAVTILFTAAAVLGAVYYFDQKNKTEDTNNTQEEVKKEEPEKTEELEVTDKNIIYINSEVGLNLREEPSLTAKILATIPFGTKLTILEEKDGWYKVEYSSKTGWISKDFTTTKSPLVYENTEYGFQLTFPETWAGYKLFKKDFGDSVALYVAIPTTDKNWTETDPVEDGYASLFAVSVYTKAKWEELKTAEGPKPGYISEKGDYIFAWSSGQAAPTDLTERFADAKTIIATFKLS